MTRTNGVDVLLMAHTRPDLLAEAVAPLRGASVRRVFLAMDGPRPSSPEDPRLIEACEDVVRAAFEGFAPVEVLRRAQHLGMKRACVEGIDWFLGRVGAGVIIEDDCVIDPTFLDFAAELLDRYGADDRVMGICGALPAGSPPPPGGASYGLVRHFGVWGWATWGRAWRCNDPELSSASRREVSAVLRRQPSATVPFRWYWSRIVRACRDGRDQNWDFPWLYSAWRHGGVFIRPDRNLVANIGHDERATQTTYADPRLSRIPTVPMVFPLKHPPADSHDFGFDRWHDRQIKGIRWSLLAKWAVLWVAPWLQNRRRR